MPLIKKKNKTPQPKYPETLLSFESPVITVQIFFFFLVSHKLKGEMKYCGTSISFLRGENKAESEEIVSKTLWQSTNLTCEQLKVFCPWRPTGSCLVSRVFTWSSNGVPCKWCRIQLLFFFFLPSIVYLPGIHVLWLLFVPAAVTNQLLKCKVVLNRKTLLSLCSLPPPVNLP